MVKVRKRLWEKAGANGIPLTVAFELLPVCNLECKMCYVRKSMSEVNAAGGLISGDRWLEIAKEAADSGLLFPLITGGEPFLHPEFRKIYLGMLNLGMQISINSNGTMIDREMAEWLSKHPPIRINITLYGASAETYEKLCGRADAFERVKNAVKWLNEYNIPIKFNFSATPFNVHDLEACVAFAKSVHAPIQVAEYMFPPMRRDEEMVGRNERLSPDDAAKARALADFLIQEPDWYIRRTQHQSRFVPIDEALGQIEATEEGIIFSCRAGRCSCWVDWQGNVINCGMYGGMKRSLCGQAFGDAWQEVLEETRAFRYRPACERCANRQICRPCAAMIIAECGTPNGRPDYICRMNEALVKYYQSYAEQIGSVDPTKIGESDLSDELSCDVNDL